jgi:hypothetical protein
MSPLKIKILSKKSRQAEGINSGVKGLIDYIIKSMDMNKLTILLLLLFHLTRFDAIH